MSEAREQSYYEIALTNRQVTSIFIVLLVCLLASFVSGVWIGREGAGVRVQTADAQRIEGEAGAGEAPLGEMDFFTDRAPAAAPRAAEPAAAQSTEPAAAKSAAQPPAEPAAKPVAEPPAPPRAAASRPRSEPAAATAPPAAAATTGSAAAATPAADFLYVQVFSSIDREQAQSIVERLRRDGYAAFLSSGEVEGRLVHRVRIGPYSQRQEAEEVAEKVRREHKLSTWITS